MTTAGSNGAPEGPADEDPFAYLYRPAEGEAAASRPRDSYARPMEVGRAQYGQSQYGQQPPAQPYPQQQPAQAQQTTQLPQQQSRYAERSRPQPGEERPSGGRGKAAVIGAVAVVAAVAIGAGIALSGGDGGKNKGASPSPHNSTSSSAPSTSASPSGTPSSAAWSGGTLVADAASMTLAGGSKKATQVSGAKGVGGSYVDGWGTVGASASWDVNLSRAATFQIWLRFNNSGANANATVSVDGTPTFTPIKLNNYSAGSPPEASWYPSWVSGTTTTPGHHTISVTCAQGNQCGFLLDQVAITDDGASKPAGW